MKLLALYVTGFMLSVAAEVAYTTKQKVVLNKKDYPIFVGYVCFPDTPSCDKPKDL